VVEMKKSIHWEIVDELVKEYKKDKSVISINVFGSLAKGNERKDSDIDFEIISTKGKKWKFSKKKIRRIEVDLVICPKEHLKYQVEKYPYLCYEYLDRKILYDPEGIMKNFKLKVKNYMKKHPEVVKFWKKKLKIMKENKAKGQDPKEAIKSYDEAEILFSKEHKITRDYFRR